LIRLTEYCRATPTCKTNRSHDQQTLIGLLAEYKLAQYENIPILLR